MGWLQVLYWLSIASIVHAYVGYPCFIVWLACRRQSSIPPCLPEQSATWPKVAILISAYNAERSIRARIENLTSCKYPKDRMTIFVASDGSTDGTVREAKQCDVSNLVVLEFSDRCGKAANLVRAIDKIEADIVLFSDATSHFLPDAVKNIARQFCDPSVGVVSGRVCMLTDSGQSAEGLYWRMESKVRDSEAKLGIMTGVSGAIYAIRRTQFVAPKRPTINDDMVFPLLAKHIHGHRFVLDRDAVAEVIVPRGMQHEFRRRRRIGLGVFQSLPLLLPIILSSDLASAFSILSHKVLRWTVPFGLMVIFLGNFFLYHLSVYQMLIVAQFLSVVAAMFGVIAPTKLSARRPLLRWCNIATSFYSMNAALLFGFMDWIFMARTVIWEPTPRPERSKPLRGDHQSVLPSPLSHDPSI